MQSSSIDFLCSQGFDFNKAFSRGIPYLKKREAERLCKTLTDKKTRMEEEAKNSGNSPNKSLFVLNECENLGTYFCVNTCFLDFFVALHRAL